MVSGPLLPPRPRTSYWRVTFRDDGGTEHFEDVEAPSSFAAIWQVACGLHYSSEAALLGVRPLENPSRTLRPVE